MDEGATSEDVLQADAIEARAFIDLYAAAPTALRDRLGLAVASHAGATLLMARALPAAMFNRVIGLGQQRPATAADLEAIEHAFRRDGGAPWWLHWGPMDEPAAFEALLRQRGYASPARRSWAKVMRPAANPPVVPTDLAIAPATDTSLAATVAAITAAFEMPPVMPGWLAALHGRPGWTVYSVLDGATPVGGGCLFVHADAGWLGMGGVVSTHRRRGGQGALMARRIADAGAAGCVHVFTETGEAIANERNPSLANMARCGFRRLASRVNFQAPAG